MNSLIFITVNLSILISVILTDIEINLNIDDNLDWYGVVEYEGSTISDIITPTELSSNSFSVSTVIDGKSCDKNGEHLSIVFNDIDLKDDKKYGVLFYKNSEWMSTGPLNKEDLRKLDNKTDLFSKVESSEIPDKIKEQSNIIDMTRERLDESEFSDSFFDAW